MYFWKYYSGNETDLLPNITKYSSEKEIAIHDAKMACYYAEDHGPFPEGEKIIATNPYYAFRYAAYVLKGPFPAGEAAIAKDLNLKTYTKYFLKKDFILNGKLICKYEG